MRETKQEAVVHGVLAGVLGYAAVVILFTIVSLMAGESPFAVPDAIGRVLTGAGGGGLDPGSVLAFNGVHMLSSVLVGVIVTLLVRAAEQQPQLWYVIMLVLMGAFMWALLTVGVLGVELTHATTWPAVLVANLAWVAAVGWYLRRFHRGLARRLSREPLDAGA